MKKAKCPVDRLRMHLDDLLAYGQLWNRDADTIRRAVTLMSEGAWSWWDALIIAAALESGCTELWSEDLQHGRVVDGRLRIVNPLLPTT